MDVRPTRWVQQQASDPLLLMCRIVGQHVIRSHTVNRQQTNPTTSLYFCRRDTSLQTINSPTPNNSSSRPYGRSPHDLTMDSLQTLVLGEHEEYVTFKIAIKSGIKGTERNIDLIICHGPLFSNLSLTNVSSVSISEFIARNRYRSKA